ncbi:Phage integrase family protein [Marininema mesophilum]|uniref:Phage integrase family protein n=2 Tax=Marininema mesophilum TaxID=1048340 RepID=A0A1H3CKJ3_9BACL|nr:Phage integrase family protein [Marininema mesophilum]
MYHDTYPKFIKTIENRMRRLLKIAKLNDTLTPHSLRHTHTSLLAEAGVSLPEIMARLGHKDDATKTCIPSHDKVNAKRGLP